MRRLSIKPLATTVFGVLVLAVLLLNSGGQTAQGATGVVGVCPGVGCDVDAAGPGTLWQMSIDMDTTGNPIGSGGLLSTVETTGSTTVGSSLFVDIIIDEVDPADGMSGFGFNLLYDPTVVNIMTKDFNTYMLGAGATEFGPQALPDATGNYASAPVLIGGFITGEGVGIRLELKCMAVGQTYLDLTDFVVSPEGTPKVADGGVPSSPILPTNVGDAQMGCGTTLTPQPAALATDVEIVSETVTGPATVGISPATGAYAVNKTIVNNGAEASVDVTLATGIIPPADCTTTVDSTPIPIVTSIPFTATTGVTTGSPPVVTTTTAHGLATGDTVVISGVVGTLTSAAFTSAASNDVNHVHTVTVIDATHFSLDGIDVITSGSGGTVSHVIGTPVAGLTSTPLALSPIPFTIECTNTSFHDFEITNEIFLDKVKLFGVCDTTDHCTDTVPGNNTMSHTTIPGSAPTLSLTQPTSTGPALRVGLTAAADASFGTVTVTNNLTDTDNGVTGAELKKGETKTISISKDVTLTSSGVLPVTFDLSTAVTTPGGCSTTPGQTDPQSVVFTALGTLTVPLTYDITCTAAGVGPSFAKTWTFDETLVPNDQHVTDATANTNQEVVTIPVIEPFVPTMNIDQDSTVDPATSTVLPGAAGQCLTTLGCEQLYEDSMGPGDPFASVVYTDFPKTSPGYTIAADAAVTNGTAMGELLGTTTINWDGGSGCGTPATNSGSAPLTDASALVGNLPAPLATTPGTDAYAHYVANISSFAGANPLQIDIVIYDMGTFYRQYRIASDGNGGTGELGTDWLLPVCNGNIDYDLFGLVGTAPVINVRSCDDPGVHTFDTTWTRDDTGGTYTATEDLSCAAADVSVVLNKDEIIGDGSPAGDLVDQGITTTRDVTVTVSGPPDTITTVSITGPVSCAPRWVSPLDPAPSVLGAIQTSVVTSTTGAGAFIYTYEVTCSPAGVYNLQIVANSTSVSAGAEANTLNNQAENVVQVIVNADNDGDGVPTPQDNCPSVPNPNQNDADSDGEGNACDINDDEDFVPLLANAVPPVVVDTVPILDNPISVADPFVPFGGPATIGPDQCNPGVDLLGGGPDLDALSAAELALWQEDNDDLAVEIPFPNAGAPGYPNFALDLDGCADTDMSVSVVKDETYDVDVSVNTPKTVTITVTNGNAAVGDATVNLLALSRVSKCEVRWVAQAGDLSSEFQTDEITLNTVDGPGGLDDYAPTPDGAMDTLQSQLEVSTGPMAADAVLVLTRDYTVHCFQPSTQYWWDSTHDTDYNFDSTMEIQIDVLPDAPVVEEALADNVHKNFPLVTANALADLKYSFTVTGPTTVPLGVAVDVEGFSTIHNNGPSPTDSQIVGSFITPPGCAVSLLSGAFLIPPGVDTGILPIPLFGTQGAPLPPSVEVILPLSPNSTAIICLEPSFHTVETTLIMQATWPGQSGLDPETGEQCQNFVDDDADGIVNDGCPAHLNDPNMANNTSTFFSNVAAIGETALNVNVDLSAVPTTGNVSQDEFFDVTKTFSQSITPFYNPFTLTGEDGTPAAPPDLNNPFGFFPCADGQDNGLDGLTDAADPDCQQTNLPNSPIFPLITETLSPPADCAVSYHVTNNFLSKIMGGAAGLTISVNGIPQSPPTPAGWEASDVVLGNQGDDVSIDFQIQVTGGAFFDIGGGTFIPIPAAPTVLTENWDKHCYAPSTHNFVMSTSWASSSLDDPHLPYASATQNDPFSEDILANSDLKIVTDFFTDLASVGTNTWQVTFVPANGAPETGNACQDSVDNDNDGVVNDGCPVEGHQKEALHNNGPYGPTAATVNIVATTSTGCDITYDVRGDETDVNGGTPAPGTQVESGTGGVIDVTFPANLPVSTDVWFAELWRFSATADGCSVTIVKTVTPVDQHILDDDGATFTKTVELCIDTDGDGVHDSGDGNCNGPDNCPNAANPGQEDTDNDGLGDVCDPDPNRPPHDGVVKYIITIGPAAINLSDTTGRYMWIIAEVGNQGGPPVTESVTVTMDIAEAVPNGCTRTPDDANAGNGLNEALVLPGQDTFTLLGLEQKFLVWRVRYECHTPATTSTFDQTVTVDIALNGNVDGNPANDSQTVVKTVIIH